MIITDKMLFDHAAEARDIWLSFLPSEAEIPEFQCSKSFSRKMRKLIKAQRHSPKTNQILHYTKRAVAVVLAVAVISFGGLMTVEAYREKVVEVVVRVFNELTDYRFSSEKTEIEEIVLPELSFGYLPGGMCEIENGVAGNNRHRIVYENDVGLFFELTLRPIGTDGDYGTILDTENSEYMTLTIRGNNAYANEKDGNSSIVWSENNIVYNLYGNLELTELTAIAEKIRLKN